MKSMAQTVVTEGINLLLPILFLLPLLLLILNHFIKKSHLPPGPYPWPILGNVLQVGDKPHITLTHLAKTYGPLISLRLGTQLVVVASSQAAAMEILKTHDRILSGRYVPHVVPAKSSKLNNLSLGWTLECNDKWKYLRTICRTEIFSGKALESQAHVRDKKVMDMLQYIGSMEGKVVKVRDMVFATVFNMLSNILVSRDLISLEAASVKGGMSGIVSNIIEVGSAPNISDFYPILGPFDLQNLRKKSMELYNRCCSSWEAIIKERREGKRIDTSSQKDFLDALVDNGSTDDQINMLLMELLTAGTDTSSSTVEWTMAELLKNPPYMKKVKEELAREINQDIINESHLSQLTFLQACIKESLRLHPPGPFLLPRRAVESCQVLNYTIPKNCQVIVNFWAIGQDPESWEEPLVFKPERFINLNLDFKGNDFEFIPFGAGRRICPGLPMAAKHVPLVLASLIHNFDWSLPYGTDINNLDMTEKFGITLRKEQPLLLIPKAKQ